MRKMITSESVAEGHPDKICDKISDKILDTALELDKNSKMAVECTIKDNLVFIYGEATTEAKLDYENIAINVLKDISIDAFASASSFKYSKASFFASSDN